MRKFLFLLFICLSAQVKAAEWQWCVAVSSMTSSESGTSPEAFLWVPPTCERLKAVLYVHQNMTEEVLIGDEWFRSELAKSDVGIVYMAPGIDYKWNDAESHCQEHFQKAMKSLADVSGYSELEQLPVIPFGHSAQATFPWNFAAWNADRTLAVLSFHGDAPRTNLCGYGRENVEWGRTRNIDGIPGLMIEGEYEWWEARVNPSLAFRMMYPGACISFLCDAGRGHFDLCPATIRYIVRFIQKAVDTRIPADGMSADGRVELKKLNSAEGWLCDRWRANQKNRPKTAPYAQYKGDRHDAFWYFDEEMARLTEQRYAETRFKQEQYVSICQEGQLLKYNPKAHIKLSAPFLPESDGITFHLSGAFTDSTRAAISDKHARNAQPRLSVVSGPCIQVDDTTFRVAYAASHANPRRWSGITLCVEADGDNVYKSAVQELNITLPRNDKGQRQSIAFPSLQDMRADNMPASIPLGATADSGLPVWYYVKQGPAIIKGGRLVFTTLPRRTRLPMQVTVVAWQPGIPDKICAATPVERSFMITH